jgi:polysaccharide pyruvyl transferase
MMRILLRAPKDPFEVVSPRATLLGNYIAENSGNLLFLEAAYRILAADGVEIVPDRLHIDPRSADRINERYDAYVIPLANAFRPSFAPALSRMTALIQRLRIPVVVLGVGAQGTVGYDWERLRSIESTVKGFASAALDRGPSIGVRGAFTQRYLNHLGFRDVDVIGCPSMFAYGPGLQVRRKRPSLDKDARVAITISPYVRAMGDVAAFHHARYPNLRYIAQDLATLAALVWRSAPPKSSPDDKLPIHPEHPMFLENKVRFFVDPWPWLSYLRDFDFAFGTRIHGSIAALLAGTPAYVFAHDSRTRELAEYHAIPHRLMSAVTPTTDAAALYEEADYTPFNAAQPERFSVFAAFLERHGLGHVLAAGSERPTFDARIAATQFPGPVDAAGVRRENQLYVRAGRLAYAAKQRIRTRTRGFRQARRRPRPVAASDPDSPVVT